MLGIDISWLRTSLLTFASLLLASGAAWAHGGGGGHGGGGHGGGIGHMGGIGNMGGIGRVGGVRFAGPLYNNGFARGLGYSPFFGRGYNGFGFGFGLGYGFGSGLFGFGFPYNGLGYGLGLGYPWYGYGYGWPYLGINSGYGYYPYYSFGLGGYPNYSGSASLNTTVNRFSAYYPSSSATAQAPPKDNMAHLLVFVPENAELWFNGAKTKQTGPQREFISPALTPGKSYSYEIKAQWTENGKPVEETRTVHVQANTWKPIDFTKAEPSADKK
jgi:uncharacterized protein (TIGR03000 family)